MLFRENLPHIGAEQDSSMYIFLTFVKLTVDFFTKGWYNIQNVP